MKNKPLPLTEEQPLRLKEIIRKGANWRSRDRAQTLLLLSHGVYATAIAQEQDLCRKTVNERRHAWLDKGFSSLFDTPRTGAPSKISVHLPEVEE